MLNKSSHTSWVHSKHTAGLSLIRWQLCVVWEHVKKWTYVFILCNQTEFILIICYPNYWCMMSYSFQVLAHLTLKNNKHWELCQIASINYNWENFTKLGLIELYGQLWVKTHFTSSTCYSRHTVLLLYMHTKYNLCSRVGIMCKTLEACVTKE